MRNLFLSLSLSFSSFLLSQTGWVPVSNFGTNPGNLNMYSYSPTNISGSAPLVVVMHGCTQNASTYATQSGWNKLADAHKFLLVYPEQLASNNSSTCFNWFQNGDQNRGQGEALSIKQMVDYMKTHYLVDTTKIYVTGLSAGACMTNVMLACYPDVFKKGAVMAGVPFKAATNAFTASNAMYGFVTNTPQAWGNLVTAQLPTYTGSYPKVAVFHGASDLVVSPTNVTEIVKQWTYMHGTDQTADNTINAFNGNSLVKKNSYNDNGGNVVVETYTITGMGHGIAVDTGNCYQKGGQTGTYAYNINGFHSSFWAAYFFNILMPTYTITGSPTIIANQSGLSYSVTNTASSYTWSVPTGASIINGQGTNQITVNFGSSSGNISVTETDGANCKVGPVNFYVTVAIPTGFSDLLDNYNIVVFPNPTNGTLRIQGKNALNLISLTNYIGEIIFTKQVSGVSYDLDLSGLTEGVYFLQLTDENGSIITKKIINKN